jgi:Xaa-Pro aminopeptidase
VQNENPGLKKYFMHGTSHHMGLEFTITVSWLNLCVNMVFTVEPEFISSPKF